MSDKKSKVKLNPISMILLVVGLICILVSVWGIFGIINEYKTAVDKYNKLEEEFVTVNAQTETTEHQEDSTEVDNSLKWYQIVSVDMDGLQRKYPDIAAWIYFENEDISYPVMHTTDNEKYLYRTYDGADSASGSIFIDARHSGDFTGTHTLVYGHNMYDMSMFARLRYYKTKEGYYNDHKYFQIFTGNRILRYQIFACQEISEDSFVFNESFTSGRELANKLVAKSMISAGVSFVDRDKIVTLSTCTADESDRFIVSAVLVGTYIITNDILIEK